MIKAGIYKEPSFNKRTFCVEVIPPDYIKVWYIEADGAEQEHWWDIDITPQKFHWLVDEWNNGNIAKVYPHWWEKVDTRKKHINSLLQLDFDGLREVINYCAYVLPHYRWTSDLHLDDDLRPLFYRGEVIRFVNISKEDAIEHNHQERIAKKYKADMELYGQTDSDYILDKINGGL